MAWSIFQQDPKGNLAVGWAEQFLDMIGAPKTPGNIQFVYQWEKSENGGGKYNPLNVGPLKGHTNLLVPGDTGSHFGGGAADYASWNAGLQGAMYGVELPAYKGVLDNLRSDNPNAAREALWQSPWAGGHYGFGKNWYMGTIPNGPAVLPPTTSSPTGGSTSGGTTTVDNSNTSTCAWSLNVGPVNGCVISKPSARAMIAAALLVGSVPIIIAGIAVLVGAAFRQNKYSQQVQTIVLKTARQRLGV